eukprot:m.287735 g.287735  ORF g.287735 m.287735 type:complete len:333 (+) comp11841_c0_seq1:1466-2464(+)
MHVVTKCRQSCAAYCGGVGWLVAFAFCISRRTAGSVGCPHTLAASFSAARSGGVQRINSTPTPHTHAHTMRTTRHVMLRLGRVLCEGTAWRTAQQSAPRWRHAVRGAGSVAAAHKPKMDHLPSMREEYQSPPLRREDVPEDPLELFGAWLNAADDAKLRDPNAMCLATADKDGMPSARMVLLKGVHEGRFQWYTNYGSKKGHDLEQNPRAALVFHWKPFFRSVRISGTVERTSAKDSDEYWAQRPRGSRLGAIASHQTQEIDSREALEATFAAVEKQYEGQEDIPRPEEWGGYALTPLRIEFWQGQRSRLHDRIEFSRDAPDQPWKIVRLSP